MSSNQKIYNSKIVGLCFLIAFFLYGFGRFYFESDDHKEKFLGALFLTTNSIVVILIGLFLRKTLIIYNQSVGNIYLFTRIMEGLILASVLLNLITHFNLSIDLTYFIAMFVLGLGSIAMCYILYLYYITPRWLSIWGLLGYSLFSIGFLAELIGWECSMYFLGPAGLWEIIFAVWLITKKNNFDKRHNSFVKTQ